METIAVYWEPLIKTYGITERIDLCLVSTTLPMVESGCIADGFSNAAAQALKLVLI